MKIKQIHTFALIAFFTMCSTSNHTSYALDNTDDYIQNSIVVEGNSVTFQDLDQLSVDDSLVTKVFDSQGNEAEIGITPLPKSVWSNSQSYKVWFVGVIINAEFYMTVTNNKVTSVSDRYILTYGGVFSNPRLTINSTKTRGQLDFIFTSAGNFVQGDCWLRGEVTGSNNQIKVTHRM